MQEHLRHIPGYTFRAFLKCAVYFWVAFGALTNLAQAAPEHAIAMRGTPKYSRDFPHLNYVNPNAPRGGTLRLGVHGSFDNMNPNIVLGEQASGVREYVYESLMARSYDEPFTLYGLLAETIDVPEDRSYALFQIRPEARFSDGTPVTPDDVLFSWKILKDKGKSNYRTYYVKVIKAEQIGERGVKFTFDASGDQEMPLIMGLMPILPRHLTSEEHFDWTTLDKPIGSGPYIVKDIRPGTSVTYMRDANYWGKDLPFNKGQFNFDEIRYDYYRDLTSLREAFRAGLFDIQGETDPMRWVEDYSFPAAREGLVKKLEFNVETPAPMTGLVFNTRKPVFADKRVRQALTELFDFQWINKALFYGLYARTESFFDRSVLSSHGRPASEQERALLAPYLADVDPDILNGSFHQPETDGSGRNKAGRQRAIALLEQAGYELDNGVMISKATGERLSFQMLCLNPEQERIMSTYARTLRQIGIGVHVRLINTALYQRQLTAFDFDMIQATWPSSLSPGNEQTFRWSHANERGSYNYPGVNSPAADAMVHAMLAAKTEEEFVAAVRALDRVLLSGRYVIPLYYPPKQWIAVRSKLHQPSESTLYGARIETWWAEPDASDKEQ